MASLFLCQVPSNAGRKEIPSVPKVRVCVPGTGGRERKRVCVYIRVRVCVWERVGEEVAVREFSKMTHAGVKSNQVGKSSRSCFTRGEFPRKVDPG